ncbi:unnamed protein product [Mytilus coruscus]|uniref:Uncharacterized protein n=1 Tax=Mytilus coruscus TaxID=42192 RepID=A0A6J8F0U5_MYTCO|nr:unnamed protein product [Mytilus coruscus]
MICFSLSTNLQFTENSTSCLDLVIANKRNVIDLVHVGHPFLNANIRYHCPTFEIIKIEKPSQTCFKRRIWLYDRGDLNLFREKLSAVDWENFIIDGNNDVDLLVENFTQIILKTAAESIPNKIIIVMKTDPPWINNTIRRAIRTRNRMNKRANKSNLPEHWSKFRKFRNETVNLVRKQKQDYIDGLVAKLRSDSLSIRSWWSRESDIPPLLDNNGFFI